MERPNLCDVCRWPLDFDEEVTRCEDCTQGNAPEDDDEDEEY